MSALEMRTVRMLLDQEAVTDISTVVEEGFGSLFPELSGSRVAVTVGSRGIRCIAEVARAVVGALKARGAAPFVIPAMGSHGGATANGQAAVLAGYGVTESFVGAPIRSSMETVEIPSDGLATRLYVDRFAWEEADWIVPINRIKSHTDFSGRHESGLLKMLVIGLGKHDQAKEIHRFGVHGLKDLIVPAARRVIETGRVLAAVGIVENAFEEPAVVEVIEPERIETREAELLTLAKKLSPRLPVPNLDILIVDELGKDKSGTGLDTKVIGRMYLPGEPEPDSPRIGLIIVRGLTKASHGNALGMGLADIVLKRFADAVDYDATYENIITSSFLERGKLPIVAESDADALRIALRALHLEDLTSIRALHIKSTLELDTFGATAAVADELSGRPGFDVSGAITHYPDGKLA